MKKSVDEAQRILEEMVKGYGDKFIGLERLMSIEPNIKALASLSALTPAMGRYYRSCSVLKDVTSNKAIGMARFKIALDYFLALNDFLTNYDGLAANQKIVSDLTSDDIKAIRLLGLTMIDVYRAEQIESVTEHDTAAATDYLKLLIATRLPHLAKYIEGIHFACTSEDNMGNVFGLIGNQLVFGHFMDALVDYCENLIAYCAKHSWDQPVFLPALTHQQAAEPITLDIITANTVNAILELLACLSDGNRVTFPFSGKMGGATGTMICHYASYPDAHWLDFGYDFVTSHGLHYTHRTNQSVCYGRESQILSTVANILTQIIKNTKDFISHASCPSQFFVKVKKEGAKGSSIMPNKSNAWAGEGGDDMLVEARDMLYSLSRRLPEYPHQGDMARSYPMRNLGAIFAPILIALDRIAKERNGYVPNRQKIEAFFHEYPGMSGAALQTVLKRMNIPGDAYREIQSISINDNGSYANHEEFCKGLVQKISKFELNGQQRAELMCLLDRRHLLKYAQSKAIEDLQAYEAKLGKYKRLANQMKKPFN